MLQDGLREVGQAPPEFGVVPQAMELGARETGLAPRVDLSGRSLRLIACGSVDDGKSTLIGRLLWDTRSVSSDHAEKLPQSSVNDQNGSAIPEFALLLDGLQAEREQGITIDVAYRYFSTSSRSFIVADTPGHEQYTRNMATGCSTADVALLLVDARAGLLEQTRRHMLIGSLMGVGQFILVVNKLDLVNYSETRFRKISADFVNAAAGLGVSSVTAIPVSALRGLNVVADAADAMPWYSGPTLLEAIENASPPKGAHAGLRMPVQRVTRPDETFRGYQGTLASGTMRPGDRIFAMPSGRPAIIDRIVTFDGDLELAKKGDSVTLVLDRPLDISRGDTIVDDRESVQTAKSFLARAIALAGSGIVDGGHYLLKTAARTQKVVVNVRSRLDLETNKPQPALHLSVNMIGDLQLNFDSRMVFNNYAQCKETGSFILIDPDSNNTIAAGMITSVADADPTRKTSNTTGEMILTLPLALGEQVLRSPLLLEHPELIRIQRMPVTVEEH